MLGSRSGYRPWIQPPSDRRLRIRFLERRRAGASGWDRVPRRFSDHATHPHASRALLQEPRDRDLSRRCRAAGDPRHRGAEGKPILANMGNSRSLDCRRGSPREGVQSVDGLAGLCTCRDSIERCSSGDAGLGHSTPSQAAEAARERLALADFLRPLNDKLADRWATDLLNEFGSFGGIMAQPAEAVSRVAKSPAAAEWLIKLADLTRHWLRERAFATPVVGNHPELMEYLRAQQAFAPAESLRVLYLNARHGIIRDEAASVGSLDTTAVSPRTILGRCLELGAAAIILVHNHPSGDATPSTADLEATKLLWRVARDLEIEVHDHLIIARGGHTSLRQLGLL